ncbi:E3 ubiquitin-protein ligase hrd1 [Phanerochaete sordida]|uniref:RING-type E3 ubiquitin transferase n=1 Tax=Phanerochaete sordida TaxID=48140 RepID=A0A9P3GH79_9APHY|nr:E3 ubiquitin-protein ligase hrd1 [Phanerochaete sordida]
MPLLNDLVRQRMQPFTSAFTANRIFLYAVFSTVATVATIANACRTYSNFYSVSVYLSRSGRSLLVLANFGFLLALLSGRILQRIFFGPLQPREVERLYDQTWMFVTESLLAFTIFRDDFDIPFVIMFGFLLFIKCFHWLMADRVESMDQVPYPGPPILFHIRFAALYCLLWTVDFVMLLFAVDSTLQNGVGGTVLFASEYAILMASALNSLARYGLSSLELRRASTRGGTNAPPWENKSMYIFYIELVTDFMKLATYLTFFVVVLTFYGLPLNIIRDVYLTARSFITRLRALIRYHNATRDMDRRYPNATEEELAAMSDRTCIICREEMIAPANNQNAPAAPAANDANNANQTQEGPNVTPKKLPCGHIFHFQCLRSWLERQQSCPTCRRTVLETDQPNRGAAQPGARGARPPAPQPNAAPQGQQPGQAAANGALGWFGRMVGVALQPPLAPGQLANGQLPPQFIPPGPQGVQPGNPGWPAPGQQLPPGYLYPYPPYPMQPLPPQQLQPPPVYRGFYGPGNQWHPWDAQWQAPPLGQPYPIPRPDEQPVAEGSRPAASSSGENASARPTPTQTEPIQEPASSPGSAGPSQATPTGGNGPATPRDAAALAALRRFQTSPPSLDTRASSDAPASSSESSSATSTDSVSPSSSDSASIATPAGAEPAPSSSAPQQAAADARPQAPPLIPLYDLTAPPPPPPPHVQALHYLQQQQQYAQRYAYRTPAPTATQGLRAPQGTPSQSHLRHRSAPRAPALAQLPATLSDEQLARLDNLTRDAIDERLRTLENVSQAVYRCVEELTRIRSVLPAREEPGTPAPGAAPAAAAADAASAETLGSQPALQEPAPGGSSGPAPEGAGAEAAGAPVL